MIRSGLALLSPAKLRRVQLALLLLGCQGRPSVSEPGAVEPSQPGAVSSASASAPLTFAPSTLFLGEAGASAVGSAVPSEGEQQPEPFAAFHEQLRRLEQGEHKVVRVLWFGDSHTAADFMTGRVRSLLQVRFGDAGPGFVPLGLKNARHETVRTGINGRWRAEPPSPASPQKQLDGVFGLLGQRAAALEPSARVEVQLRAAKPAIPLHWQLVYRLANASAELAIQVGEAKEVILPRLGGSLKGAGAPRVRASQLMSFDVVAQSDQPLSVRSVHEGVELFGAIAERAERGVVLDSLGINGARIWTPLAWHRGVWLGEIAERDPALLVLEYGTNEASDGVALTRYADAYREIISEVRAVKEDVSCLLLGPTARGDEKGQARVPVIDEFQERLALELGCGYFSLFRAMGGTLGFAAWRFQKPALAGNDGVHLTRAGYDRLADEVSHYLIHGYEARHNDNVEPADTEPR